MSYVQNILERLSIFLMVVSGICLVMMMMHVFVDVSSKIIVDKPVPGTAEIVARYYMLAAVFLPLPLVEVRNSAIVVDLFYEMLSIPFRRLCIVVAYLGQSAFFGLLAYRSFWDAVESFRKSEFVDGTVPIIVWPASVFLPLGFGVAFLVSVLRSVQTIWLEDWQQAVAPHAAHEGNPTHEEAV